ncbi:hypothetical protein SLA2020_524840 [Shorea laevis]
MIILRLWFERESLAFFVDNINKTKAENKEAKIERIPDFKMNLPVKEEWPFRTSEIKLTIAVVDTEIQRMQLLPHFSYLLLDLQFAESVVAKPILAPFLFPALLAFDHQPSLFEIAL